MFFVSGEMQYDENGRSCGQLVTGSLIRRHAHSRIMSRAEFFGETSSHPGDLAPLQLRFGALPLLAFPKREITFEGKRFQTIDEIQENTTGQLMATGRTV